MFKVIHCFDYFAEEDTTFTVPFEASEFSGVFSSFNAIRPRFSRDAQLREFDLVFNFQRLDGFREVVLQNRETEDLGTLHFAQVEGILDFVGEDAKTKEFNQEYRLRYDVVTLSEEAAELANDTFSFSGGFAFDAMRKMKMIKVVDAEYFNAVFGGSQ
ncbi:hypothetical protein [Thiomicrospira sp.]|uniref:hypothetical protein n=1 Tax=Thiomicrospira sp. TaxID=935 RepID=UPI002F92CDC0